MNKVLFLGDLHLWNHKFEGGELVCGINRRCQELLDALDLTVSEAVAMGCSAVVQVGDFFDQARPSGALLDAAIQLMLRHPVAWHIMAGNHDLAAFGTPSGLAPLRYIPGICVYEQPTQLLLCGRRVTLIPYVAHSVLEALELSKGVLDGASLVVMHYGVVANPSRPDQISLPQIRSWWAEVMGQSSRDRFFHWIGSQSVKILSGHEHGERTVAEFSMQNSNMAMGLGSFADLDWSAVRFPWPHAVLMNMDTWDVTPMKVHGPVFCVVGTEEPTWDPKEHIHERMLLRDAINSRGHGMYISGEPEHQELLGVLKVMGLIQGFRLSPSDDLEVCAGPGMSTDPVGFQDLEEAIAEVLVSQGADLADEKIQRIWSECITHIKER